MSEVDCERHKWELELQAKELNSQAKCIEDLYEKFAGVATVISVLPEKVDVQTGILQEVKEALKVLPDHNTQITVISGFIEDYKAMKKDYESVKQKVIKMDAEWLLIKWGIPVALTILIPLITFILTKLL